MTSLYRATKTLTLGINTLSPRQNDRHFPDDIFKCIFLNENVWVPIEISLKFVPKGPINNIPALVQIMAWRRSGDKPLSEPMMVSLLTHICVTRPQWVKSCITYQMTRYFSSRYSKTKNPNIFGAHIVLKFAPENERRPEAIQFFRAYEKFQMCNVMVLCKNIWNEHCVVVLHCGWNVIVAYFLFGDFVPVQNGLSYQCYYKKSQGGLTTHNPESVLLD